MTTYALGIEDRIDHVRGMIARIEGLRARCRELEASRADPVETENARALWKAHEREFGYQWETVKAVIEHYTTTAAVTSQMTAGRLTPEAPAAPARKGVARALTSAPSPEVRRARYLAGKEPS